MVQNNARFYTISVLCHRQGFVHDNVNVSCGPIMLISLPPYGVVVLHSCCGLTWTAAELAPKQTTDYTFVLDIRHKVFWISTTAFIIHLTLLDNEFSELNLLLTETNLQLH